MRRRRKVGELRLMIKTKRRSERGVTEMRDLVVREENKRISKLIYLGL